MTKLIVGFHYFANAANEIEQKWIFMTPSPRMRLISNKHFVVLFITLLVRYGGVAGSADGKTRPLVTTSI
jgi:hypothetical protein